MKKINIIIFGVGNVGSTLITQLLNTKQKWEEQGIKLEIPVIANSRKALFKSEGIDETWKEGLEARSETYELKDIDRKSTRLNSSHQ